MEEARVFLESVLPVRERGGTMICGGIEEFGEAQTGSKLGKIVIGYVLSKLQDRESR